MKFYMAPMEGVTTDVFRRAYHAHFTPFDKYFTPFIVPYEKEGFAVKEWREIAPERNKGMYVVPQILTNSSAGFLHTAKNLKEVGYQEVNLNLGCPSKTVASKGRGSGFLAFPEELDRFLYEIFESCDMKISLKTRIGKESPLEFERLLAIYEKYPLEELIIHPRVMTDYYKNTPKLDVYRFAEENSKHSLCYNGDLRTKEDYKKIRSLFLHTDKVMIGRGIVHNPFALEEMKFDKSSEIYSEDSLRRLKGFHYDMVENYREICKTEKNLLYKMKEIWFYMGVLFPEEKEYLDRIRRSNDMTEMNNLVDFILN